MSTALRNVVVLALFGGVVAKIKLKTPNILFILADDYGWNDIGYHANHSAQGYYNSANMNGEQTTNPSAGMMKTPTLDSLAAQGVKLESYYVQPLCSPTRSTIMTGRYASHTGVGPDVLVENVPYGTPGREVFMAEYLHKAGYATHAVGKWHLGSCDDRYMATYRGFDSYQGYLHGAEGYWKHAGDYRNSTTLDNSAGETPVCSTPAQVNGIYSATLESEEVSRIVAAHDKSKPIFVYAALHSVHGPNEDPFPIVDVNKTFGEIVDYQRRIFAGMVLALDLAVANITNAFKQADLWEDTVLVFSTDNGGISSGNNFPLRGCKVLNWEGGVHGIGFVRGTDSVLAPVPTGGVTHELMHTTDWLPTLVGLAGGDVSTSVLPLDGVNQWPTIAKGHPTTRKFIIHNVPITATPVVLPAKKGQRPGYTTSVCLSSVDNRTGSCHPFGVTGGAIRVGDFKLLVSHPGAAPWEDSSPRGTGQGLPGGRYPNGSSVFTPTTPTTVPNPVGNVYDESLQRNITVYLFNIKLDPTESNNIANTSTAKLQELLQFYNDYASKPDTVMDLSWRYGFQDPHSGTIPDTPNGTRCAGAFNANGGSQYCHYGQEWECYVRGREPVSASPIGTTTTTTTTAQCQAACAAYKGCMWWVLRNKTATSSSSVSMSSSSMSLSSSSPSTSATCEFYGASEGGKDCALCEMGPHACPGMGDTVPRVMTQKTVEALLYTGRNITEFPSLSWTPENIFETMATLDNAGYFSGKRG